MKRVLMLVLLGSLFAGIPSWLGAQAPAPVIREVVFQGFQNLPADVQQQLRGQTAPLVGQPLNQEQVDNLVAAINATGYFLQVTSRTEPVEGGVRLVIVVEENPVVHAIEFQGNTVLPNTALLAVISTKPGQVLNREQVTRDAAAIQEAYTKAGYPLVTVSDINITEAGTLVFTVSEPTISEIRIEGNRRTKPEVIRRELMIKPGDVYNVQAIRASLLNLQHLGIFEDVTATPQPGATPGTIILVITVREQRTGFASFGVTYSEVGGFSGSITFAEANLFGLAQQLNLRLQFGARQIYELSYFNPWIAPNHTSLGVNLYSRDIIRELIFENNKFEFTEDRTGGTVTVGRPISLNTRVYATLRADHIKSSPHDNVVPSILLQDVDVRSLALSAIRDTRTSLFYPVGGSYASAGAEVAGLLGGADFTRLNGELRRYWVVGRRPSPPEAGAPAGRPPKVLAARLLAGTALGTPPLLDEFFAGGANTLRGYQEDLFPGNRLLILNTELRIPLSDTLQVVTFVDAGDAWGGIFADEFGDRTFKLRAGYGLGVRVQTPIGPLRLDYGFNNEGGTQFHFGVGPTF